MLEELPSNPPYWRTWHDILRWHYLPPDRIPCDGPGTCHGWQVWCSNCNGAVDDVCEWVECGQHDREPNEPHVDRNQLAWPWVGGPDYRWVGVKSRDG